MSAAAETINVEEKFSGSSLVDKPDGLYDGAENLFAPASDGELYHDAVGAANGIKFDPRVCKYIHSCYVEYLLTQGLPVNN